MREVNFHLLHFFEVDLNSIISYLFQIYSRIFALVCVFFASQAYRYTQQAKKQNQIKNIFALVFVFFASQAYRYTRRAKKRKIDKNWWAQVDSNHRPHAYQACALTT